MKTAIAKIASNRHNSDLEPPGMAVYIGGINMAEVITNTGLKLPEHFTEEQFFEAGKFLSRIEQGMQWAIGDWYNAIPWGDKEAACERAGLNYKTAYQYGWIASKYQISMRIENLKFNHHAVLAGMADIEQRRGLLIQAQENGWTAARLTKERDRLLGKPEKVPLLTFDSKVDRVLESLPKTATKKVRNEIKRAMDDLRHDFEKEVHHHAQESTKQQRERLISMEKEAQEELERARYLRMNLDGLMSEDEYRLIRGCLHPDRISEDRRQQFAKAFEVFTRLEKSVNKEMPEKLRNARGWS